MKYALNLDSENRVLSASPLECAPINATPVDSLPSGDIADYLYIDGEYIYNPLPKVEEEIPITYEERIAALEMALLELMGVSTND